MSRLSISVRRKVYAVPPTVALEALEFDVEHGQFVAIVGPSGAGKSTLLNIVAGLDGDVDGRVESDRSGSLAFVFQTPRLMPWLTVLENIQLVLPAARRPGPEAQALIEEVGLGGFEGAYPGQLSGGMQRRVALARAFCVQPDLLLMDEPFASLDEPLAWRLRGQLIELWEHHEPTVLFVTHDLVEALSLADRVLFLSARPGRIVLDLAIDLPRPRLAGDPGVDALRARILREHPRLLSGDSAGVPDPDRALGRAAPPAA